MRILLLLLVCVIGCGETSYEKAQRERAEKRRQDAERIAIERDNRNKSLSLVEVVAEKLSLELNDDKSLKFYKSVDGKDSWANPLTIKYTESGLTQTVEVRSMGTDGLLFTRDDLIAKRSITLPVKPGVPFEKRLEGSSQSIFRGMFKGIREGLK